MNRRLRTIWKEHASSIVEEILSMQIPAYEDAVKVTNTEMQFSDDGANSLDLKAANQIGKWLPNLLRNAEMASEMCEAVSDSSARKPKRFVEHSNEMLNLDSGRSTTSGWQSNTRSCRSLSSIIRIRKNGPTTSFEA